MKKPRIAILMFDSNITNSIDEFCVPKNIINSVILSGGLPFIVTETNITEKLDVIKPDGILVPGGVIAVPLKWQYGETLPEKYNAFLSAIEMIKYAKENNLPLFTICAGMHIMARFYGRLLGPGIPPRQTQGHRFPGIANVHDVDIIKNSLLHKIIGKDTLWVNSRHNFGLDYTSNVGDFNVTATAGDIIEAIEPKLAWSKFVLGVQWHPEDLTSMSTVIGDDSHKKLFDEFIKASGNAN